MKKILLFAAMFVAMVACNKVDEFTPAVGGHTVNVSVSAEESADTRVAYDDDWVTTWDEGDALLAINGSGETSKFTMDAYDATNPIFSGDALNGNYNLLYPYSVVDVKSDAATFDLDLTTQSAGANHTYMISKEMIDMNETDISVIMKHIGATMVLDMKFTGYEDYTIESLEVSGLNGKGVLDANTTFDNILSEQTVSTITITDGATIINEIDGIEKVRFNILPTTIEAGGEVRVNAHLRNNHDVVALTKTITTDEGVVFDRAKYHTLKCGFSSEDVMGPWTEYAADNFAGGDGSEGNPYQISTAEELAKLAKETNSTKDMYKDKYFKLTADIDLSGHEWTPIGNDTNIFKGSFDGGDYDITGIYVNKKFVSHQPVSSQGLFGFIDGATVMNISVSGFVLGQNYIGGIVGYANSSTITNCCYNGSIETDFYNAAYIGRVVGHASNSVITNCYNSGSIIGSSYTEIGGIVGYISGSTITNCYNSGSMEGRGGSGSVSGNEVGGIVGYADKQNTITNCYNSGFISGRNPDSAGGIVGYNYKDGDMTITNCYNVGTISTTDYARIGGIIGRNFEGTITITNCYNSGSVNCSNNDRIGGIVGQNFEGNSIITNCYYQKDGSLQGVGFNAPQTGIESMTAAEMMDDSFTTLLNNNGCDINDDASLSDKACAWVTVGNDYPTLDFDGVPVRVDVKFSGGAGKADVPYKISSRADFDELSEDVNNNGINYKGKSFVMVNDVDLGGSANPFTAIGCNNKFKGTFDGAGYTVSGLYIYSSNNSQALFGQTYEAIIKNLSVLGDVKGNSYTAGIVGMSEESKVVNCHSGVNVSGNNYVGGVVGQNDQSIVANCYSSGEVSGSKEVGGVTGNNIYSKSIVDNCYSSGKVSGSAKVGGVVGRVDYSYSVIACVYNITVNSDDSFLGIGVGGGETYGWTDLQMQDDYFKNTLNSIAKNYNGTNPVVPACAWGWESGKYPYLTFKTLAD